VPAAKKQRNHPQKTGTPRIWRKNWPDQRGVH
jgi:hypothetical protein